MIPLKQIPGVYAIPVPKDSKEIKMCNFDYFILVDEIPIELSVKEIFEILGTVTADEIDFDTECFIDLDNKIILSSMESFKKLCEGAFRSLLESNDIFFKNPLGEKPEYFESKNTACNQFTWSDYILEWQTAQSKVVDKLVILRKI